MTGTASEAQLMATYVAEAVSTFYATLTVLQPDLIATEMGVILTRDFANNACQVWIAQKATQMQNFLNLDSKMAD
jgi:hypothetical protein